MARLAVIPLKYELILLLHQQLAGIGSNDDVTVMH